MNFSETVDTAALRPQIYNYLGFHGVGQSEQTDVLIDECIRELEKTARFRYLYKSFDSPPEFLNKEPYTEFLRGASGVIISAMTLGVEVDRRSKLLFRTDMPRAVVFDACASAYLEHLSDEYEKTIGDDLSFRFCPGYGGSSVKDLKYIFDILRPEKIGMALNSSDFMLPSKSMAGIIAVGKKTVKSCKNCIMYGSCSYIKEGSTCYGSVKR